MVELMEWRGPFLASPEGQEHPISNTHSALPREAAPSGVPSFSWSARVDATP